MTLFFPCRTNNNKHRIYQKVEYEKSGNCSALLRLKINTKSGHPSPPQPTTKPTTPPHNPISSEKLKTWSEIKRFSKLNTLDLSLVVQLDWSWTLKLGWTDSHPQPPPPPEPTFFRSKNLFGPKIIWDPQFVWTQKNFQNFFFSEPKNDLGPNFILDQQFMKVGS